MNNSKGVHEKDMFLVTGHFSEIRVHYDIKTPKFETQIYKEYEYIKSLNFWYISTFLSWIFCPLVYIRILEIRWHLLMSFEFGYEYDKALVQ